MPLQAGDGVYFDGKSKGEPVCIAERLGIAAGLVQALADRPAYWHPGWDRGWGHMIFGSLMMGLFWGGVMVLIRLAVRWKGRGS